LVASAVQGANEGLAEAVIRGVAHREQLIRNIRSMKAISWQDRSAGAPDGPRAGSRLRELFLLEGDKERTEWLVRLRHNGKPGARTEGSRAAAARAGGGGPGVRAAPIGPPGGRETRTISGHDGRTAWVFTPAESGSRPRLWRGARNPGGAPPAMAAWAGIAWRFGMKADSSFMREGKVTAERTPGPPERYKVTSVMTSPERGRSVWWVAPEYGYAVTRHETEYFGHPRRFAREYEQFKELAPGVWLPQRGRGWMYVPTADGKWKVADYYSGAAQVMKLNIDIPDDNFRVPTSE
jgi:hypothetical protein